MIWLLISIGFGLFVGLIAQGLINIWLRRREQQVIEEQPREAERCKLCSPFDCGCHRRDGR